MSDTTMCSLCEQPITDFRAAFHHLDIDASHSVDICSDCMEKILKWQGEKYAKLFPTGAMKKRFGKKG